MISLYFSRVLKFLIDIWFVEFEIRFKFVPWNVVWVWCSREMYWYWRLGYNWDWYVFGNWDNYWVVGLVKLT